MNVLAPASGIVLGAGSRSGSAVDFMRIFISPFDDHTVLSPAPARVASITHRAGLRFPAFLPAAWEHNTQLIVELERQDRERLIVRVIGGLLTRRIIALAVQYEEVAALDRLAFIALGSMVEVKGRLRLLPTIRPGHAIRLGDVCAEW